MALEEPKKIVSRKNIIDVYKRMLKYPFNIYIHTRLDNEYVQISVDYESDNYYYTTQQINYLQYRYYSLVDEPDNIYDEVADRMSNIYELMTKDYVIDTHTFIGENGPKCVINFGKIEDNIIKYFNPKTKKYCDINSISEFKFRYNNLFFIEWEKSPIKNKIKDEEVPEDQIGISVCKICYENKVNILFFPCKHAVSCVNCSECLNCPICKRLITSTRYIFIN
ncbi:hypothetical protein AGMMS49579_01480 [Spirochaetia bacterium]|nr:hypothetical protein AGMMS49579_01480 [Spirochaetia bacterium]